jgi:DNA gyrase subunit A
LTKAEERKHILEGLVIALDNLDPVIDLIRAAKSVDDAKFGLMGKYGLTEIQSQAILDMKLQRLTNLEQGKIRIELDETMKLIIELNAILASRQRILDIIKNELLDIKERFDDARRTEIVDSEEFDIETEDLIKEENVVITVSHSGYVKRQTTDTYKTQGRGGKGIIGASTNEEDFVEDLFVTCTHSYLLLFTDLGQMHWLKAYQIPEGSRTSKGKALVNMVRLEQNERITANIPVREFNPDQYLVMVTKKGVVKRCKLDLFNNPRAGGIRAITLDEGDELVNVLLTDGNSYMMIATKNGMAVRFHENDARSIGRTARGVKGISLRNGDEVIDTIICHDNDTILTVTEKGYGKRTPVTEYRIVRRGGVGVTNIKCTDKNGPVVATRDIKDSDEIMLISQKGIMIRMSAKNVSVIGRSTQGVRLMKLQDGDKVMAAAKIVPELDSNGSVENGTNSNNSNINNPVEPTDKQ